ncbi:MAG: CsbD family protein [Gemmatimonadales bacterium]|nr:CsbD family protein [Gemmatimonadales bacterium]
MSDPNAFDRVSPAEDQNWEASWETEDNYWHENFSSRPYSLGADYYDRFRPAFRYGYESGAHGLGRTWDDAEPDLRAGWERYEHRGQEPSAWEEIKGAVRDAWDRVSGGRTSEAEGRTPQIRE